MKIELSVVIPTYKPRLLDRTLNALLEQVYSEFEVLVIENGSEYRSTRELVFNYKNSMNIQYVFVPESGLNNARNIGTRKSEGKLVALTDDDCMPNKHWTQNIVQSYSNNSKAGIIGGKVKLFFESSLFNWFLSPFRELVGELDLGNAFKELSSIEYLVGANFSFTRKAFEEVGGFDLAIGQKGRNFQANDEVLFLERVKSRGFQVFYNPQMEVVHNIPPKRQTIEYIEKRFYGQGISDVKKEKLLGKNSQEILEFLEMQLFDASWSLELLERTKRNLDNPSKKIYWENFMRARIAYLNGIRTELFGGNENENMS